MKKRIVSTILSICLMISSAVIPNKCSALPCIDNRRNGFLASVNTFVESHSLILYSVLGITMIGGAIETLGKVSKSFSQIGNANYYFQNLVTNLSNVINRFSKKFEKDLTVNEKISMLKTLCEDVKGQEIAKTKVLSIIYGIIHDKNQAQISGEKYSHGDVLYFVGPSGVGKTFLAEHCIAPVMSKISPYIISASEVDKSSGNETIIDQLFGLDNYISGYRYGYGGGYGGDMMSKRKSLVEYLENNPNGIVIVNEYDKMWCQGLDEIFRTIMDQGIVTVKGQKIDCSGTTFIITSNESSSSVFGGNQDEIKDIDDGTGSRTYIKHDKSFLNRAKIVEFSNLTAEEYEKIALKEFNEKVVNYWKNPEVAGINIELDDTIKHISLRVESQNQGARCITDIRYKLIHDIVSKITDSSIEYYTGKTIYVSYDENKNEFTLYDNNPQE